jgi:tRNA threonylcarbamoyladenosine biosynthesis protein TsaE
LLATGARDKMDRDVAAITDKKMPIVTATADETKAWGRRLGRAMRVGDVVGLVGPLGAGKTTLTQGIAEGMQISARRHVASPTFALVNEHPGKVPLLHADLYRVSSPAELFELGLEEAFDRTAAVIEWIDRIPGAAPADHLRVTIAIAEDGARHLELQAHGPVSERLVQAVTTDGSDA